MIAVVIVTRYLGYRPKIRGRMSEAECNWGWGGGAWGGAGGAGGGAGGCGGVLLGLQSWGWGDCCMLPCVAQAPYHFFFTNLLAWLQHSYKSHKSAGAKFQISPVTCNSFITSHKTVCCLHHKKRDERTHHTEERLLGYTQQRELPHPSQTCHEGPFTLHTKARS